MATAYFSRLTTLRNVAYSFLWALVAWLFFWLFWFSALPRGTTVARVTPPVIRYVSSAAPALGISWAQAPIVIPGRSKLMLREEQFHAAGMMTNSALPPEYLDRMPGGYSRRVPDGAREWAASSPVKSGDGTPQFFEEPVYKPGMDQATGWRIEIITGLQGADLGWSETYKDEVPAIPRSLAVTAWIETGLRGEIRHAFLEQTSGNVAVDRAALKRLYAVQVKNGFTNGEGRVRLTVPGKP